MQVAGLYIFEVLIVFCLLFKANYYDVLSNMLNKPLNPFK